MWTHTDWNRVRVERLNPLLDRQIVSGEKVMIVRWRFKKGCIIPLHHHANEQISIVEDGALRFLIDGSELSLSPGGILCIPSNVPHQVEAIENSVAVDVFTPPREDFLTGSDDYLRR